MYGPKVNRALYANYYLFANSLLLVLYCASCSQFSLLRAENRSVPDKRSPVSHLKPFGKLIDLAFKLIELE